MSRPRWDRSWVRQVPGIGTALHAIVGDASGSPYAVATVPGLLDDRPGSDGDVDGEVDGEGGGRGLAEFVFRLNGAADGAGGRVEGELVRGAVHSGVSAARPS